MKFVLIRPLNPGNSRVSTCVLSEIAGFVSRYFSFQAQDCRNSFGYLSGFPQGQGALRPEDLSKGVDCEVGQLTEFVEDPFSAMVAGFVQEEGDEDFDGSRCDSGAMEMY